MSLWRLATLVLGLLIAGYIYRRLVRRLTWSRQLKLLCFLGLLLGAMGLNLGHFTFAGYLGDTIFVYWRSFFFFLFVFLLTLFSLLLLGDVLLQLPLCCWNKLRSGSFLSPLSAGTYGITIVLLALLFTLWGQYEGLRVPRVQKITLSSSDISRPVSIAVISDLHITRVSSAERIAKIVKTVNDLSPDLIVLPGDILDDQLQYVQPLAQPLMQLQAPLGVFYVSGNHEYYMSMADARALIEELGFEILENQGKAVREDLYLGGIPDLKASVRHGRPARPELALAGAAANQYVVMLSHEPVRIPGANLVISGHTHGGQMLPFQLFAKIFNQGFLAGLYEFSAKERVWVSRGSGTWGPAFRLFAPSDISLLVLLPKQESTP